MVSVSSTPGVSMPKMGRRAGWEPVAMMIFLALIVSSPGFNFCLRNYTPGCL